MNKLDKKEYQKRYRLSHLKELRAYFLKHKDKINQQGRIRYAANAEKNRAYANANRKKHLEKVRQRDRDRYKKQRTKRKAAVLSYYYLNHTKIALRRHKKYQTQEAKARRIQMWHENIDFRLRQILRHRVWVALKKNKRPGSAIRDLGCTISELKIHLENQFKEGMSWQNWTFKGWHIDHIIPLASFDLQKKDQFFKAVHYTNLQPLWWRENISKGSRI